MAISKDLLLGAGNGVGHEANESRSLLLKFATQLIILRRQAVCQATKVLILLLDLLCCLDRKQELTTLRPQSRLRGRLG